MTYQVKVLRWTPDDWVIIKMIECKYLFSAKFLKFWFVLRGYARVVIE